MALHRDPKWPRASEWLAGLRFPQTTHRLGLLGLPLGTGSVSPGRCDLAPEAIRTALQRFSTYDVEADRDLRAIALHDHGDLALGTLSPEDAFEPIRDAVKTALEASGALACFGGNNAITRPAMHGLGNLERCGLLTLDAHFDLRDTGPGMLNGNPVRALLEDGLPGDRIVQIGIQAFVNSAEYAAIAREAGIHVVPMGVVKAQGLVPLVEAALERLAQRCDHLYVDVDLDTLDRAFSPGTPGSRPGGFLPWELQQAVRRCGAHPKVRVVDFVELDPPLDLADTTALGAAMAFLSFATGLLERA